MASLSRGTGRDERWGSEMTEERTGSAVGLGFKVRMCSLAGRTRGEMESDAASR